MPAMQVISGSAHPALAAEVAADLQLALTPVQFASFADGEVRIHIDGDLRGSTAFVVQPTSPPVNDHLVELALLIDAARAAGASQVTAVVPYFGYARQELRSAVGDPRSAQVAIRFLASVDMDHLITVDLHAPALESAFPMPITHLRAEEVLLPTIQRWGIEDLVVVSPDAGGLKRAQRMATALASRVAVVAKDRPSPDMTRALQVLGDVRGCSCLLIDDMASTGRTLVGAAEALRQAGAREVRAAFTHAVMAPGALERLQAASFAALLTTNTIPLVPQPGMDVVSIAPQLVRSMQNLASAAEG